MFSTKTTKTALRENNQMDQNLPVRQMTLNTHQATCQFSSSNRCVFEMLQFLRVARKRKHVASVALNFEN